MLYMAILLLLVCGIIHQNGAGYLRCTTDYISTLNCSCSSPDKTVPWEIEANCSDAMGFTDGRCVIRPPLQWCTIQPDSFFLIANPDTTCTLKAKRFKQLTIKEEIIQIDVPLEQMIKPQKPDNLTLTKNNKEFNISWEMAYNKDETVELSGYLVYRVRLRPKDFRSEEKFKIYNVREDRRYHEIQCDQLTPGKVYVVDVQASVNFLPNPDAESEWSEWSPSIECTCPHPKPDDPIWLFFMLPLALTLLGFFGFWYRGMLKKPCLFQYIPDPYDFFKPLYHTYQGDFKKWVGPVFTFSNFDMLEKSAPLQVLCEKQLPVTPQQRPILHDQGSEGSSVGDWSLLSLMNPDLSKRYFLGGSSLGLAHSGGHISMDTVTVSGQEGAMLDFQETNQNAVQVPGEAEDQEQDSRESSEDQQSFDDWRLQANDAENGERLSLDSFSSNEHSDYGYPQIALDLDTIDSGFLESDCSSPVSSECEGGEGMDTALLGSTVGTHSNYVKQWVAFMPASGENSNSV
ncbi:interleukin 21 receptor, tandem duplicate 1 isoform X2 [Silurus meridionalis]|uniref:interleukin 21 receptor, tandem duplicate 1 isoform X2 n=1 Tax=Silurus meridionalis TaxID=175797 RepID=UPI001EE9E0DC|nr:interleukin 21 receptor, tandem duplicate 1 isoform X2 [Silurus meridionalis]